jgi:hypothetical protein
VGERDGLGEVDLSNGSLLCVPVSLQGCVETMGAWLRKNVLLVAAVALGIAFVEVSHMLGRGWDSVCGIWGEAIGRSVLSRRYWPPEGSCGCVWEPLGGSGVACTSDSLLHPSLFFLLDPGNCLCLLPCEEYPKWL